MTVNKADTDQEAVAIANVMKATGLSENEVRRLLVISDDKLDELCDTALSDLGKTPER